MYRGTVKKASRFELRVEKESEQKVLEELHNELPKLIDSGDLDYYQQQIYASFYDPEVPKNKNKHNLNWLSKTFGFDWTLDEVANPDFISEFQNLSV